MTYAYQTPLITFYKYLHGLNSINTNPPPTPSTLQSTLHAILTLPPTILIFLKFLPAEHLTDSSHFSDTQSQERRREIEESRCYIIFYPVPKSSISGTKLRILLSRFIEKGFKKTDRVLLLLLWLVMSLDS